MEQRRGNRPQRTARHTAQSTEYPRMVTYIKMYVVARYEYVFARKSAVAAAAAGCDRY